MCENDSRRSELNLNQMGFAAGSGQQRPHICSGDVWIHKQHFKMFNVAKSTSNEGFLFVKSWILSF